MKPARPSVADSATGQLDVIGPHAEVKPDKYYEIARQHVAANGGEGVVIDERKTPRQWRAWLAYFAWLDGQTWPRGRKAPTMRLLRNGATVPTEWPIAFDLNAPPQPSPFFEPDEPPEVALQRRRELGAMLRHVVAGFVPPEPRRSPSPDARYAQTPAAKAQATAHHEVRLAELANMPPATLSASLAARFAPPEPSEAWPGQPVPEPPEEPGWASADQADLDDFAARL